MIVWIRTSECGDKNYTIPAVIFLCLKVSAIDHSGRLIDAAIRIQEGKVLNIKGAGELLKVNISLDEIKPNIDRVKFQQVSWKLSTEKATGRCLKVNQNKWIKLKWSLYKEALLV